MGTADKKHLLYGQHSSPTFTAAIHSMQRGTNHCMVVLHDFRLFKKRLSALILSRLAELRQEVIHDKDTLDGGILLD